MKLVPKKAFTNGKIFTCNDKQPWAESVIVSGDKILFVGSDSEANNYFDAETEIINLDGDLMLPGFIDSHLHFMTGGFSFITVDLSQVRSRDEFQSTILKFLSDKKQDWITGGNWDNNKFHKNVFPSKEWVDSATGDIPLFVTRTDLHMGLANSKALAMAGITEETPNPEGGVIQKDKISGQPTGILIDNAMQKLFDILPEPSLEESFKALEFAMKEANKFGITSVHDIVYPKDYTVYQDYTKENKLTCRINLVRPISELENFMKLKIHIPFGNEFIQMGALKGLADGSLGSGTAWFFDPYNDDGSSTGLPMDILTNGKLKEWALKADRNRLQLVIHAIGDRAVSSVLDIYEEIINTNPKWDRRLRLEHAQHIRKKDIERMSKMGVIASMQPLHLYYDGIWCEAKIGKDRINGTYAIKSILDAGITACFGSDWTVTSLNPLMGIFAAVTRNVDGNKFPEGWNPSERISVKDAVRGYTINAAYASFNEKTKGSIEAGKLADMVILTENIFEIPIDKISGVSVKRTIFGGEIVYDNPGS
ncbi:amidohydrolase [Bacteroidota bacterium]